MWEITIEIIRVNCIIHFIFELCIHFLSRKLTIRAINWKAEQYIRTINSIFCWFAFMNGFDDRLVKVLVIPMISNVMDDSCMDSIGSDTAVIRVLQPPHWLWGPPWLLPTTYSKIFVVEMKSFFSLLQIFSYFDLWSRSICPNLASPPPSISGRQWSPSLNFWMSEPMMNRKTYIFQDQR